MLRRISVHATSIVNILTRPRSSSYLGRSVSSAILRPFVSPQQKKIWVNRLVKSNGSDRESAERELRWIGEEISRRENSQGSSSFSKDTVERMIAEREDGTPLQYVLGNQPFGPDLVLNVRRPVLIPRPETEEWASRLADLLTSLPSSSPRINLLDLCTGTGCIPLLICKSFERANRPLRALGVDILPQAVDLAKENARLSGIPTLPCTAGRNRDQDELLMTFDVRKGDMFDPSFKDGLRDVWGNIDVLTSNPPYIPLYEIESLDENVRSFESPLALLGDLPNLPSNFYPQHLQHYQTHGLDFYLQIAHLISAGLVRPPQSSSQTSSSSNHRTPQVILEVGYNQASAVKEILKEGPAKELMESVEGWKDFAGIERVVVGFLKERS